MSDEPKDSRPITDGVFKGPLDQEAFRALLFNSFLNQQNRVRVTRKEGELLQALAAMHREVLRAADVNAALNLITARALEVTGATGVAIAIMRQGQMTCTAVSGPTAPPLGTPVPESGISGECVGSGKAVRCNDTASDPRVDQQACAHLGGLRSMLLMPVFLRRSVIGILEVFSTAPFAFDDTDEHVLQLVGAVISETISACSEPEPATRASRSANLGMRPSSPPISPA